MRIAIEKQLLRIEPTFLNMGAQKRRTVYQSRNARKTLEAAAANRRHSGRSING
jgi:hypothetical protein